MPVQAPGAGDAAEEVKVMGLPEEPVTVRAAPAPTLTPMPPSNFQVVLTG